MTRALFLTVPLLAACVHTPTPCDVPWPRTCEERRDEAQDRPFSANPQPEPKAERPVDVSPPAATPDSNGAHSGDKPKDHSRDDNGGSSDGNGGDSSDDGNGGKS